MKKITPFIAFLFIIASAAAQQNLVGKYYVTTIDKLIVYPASQQADTNTEFYFVHIGTIFTVTGIDKDNNLLISFQYKNPGSTEQYAGSIDTSDKRIDKSLPKGNKTNAFPTILFKPVKGGGIFEEEFAAPPDVFIDSWAHGKSFIMDLSSFSGGTKQFYGKSTDFNWGFMTLPVRLRFGNKENRYFNFEEKLNLGLTAGIKKQLQGKIEHSLNYMAGVGITNAKTDSVSLKPGYYDSNNTSELALTVSLGILYQYESFQVGIFVGKDYLPSTLSRQWLYQGKTWLGIAIGVSLFSKKDPSTAVAKN